MLDKLASLLPTHAPTGNVLFWCVGAAIFVAYLLVGLTSAAKSVWR